MEHVTQGYCSLKQGIFAEPLINSWYATSSLLAPFSHLFMLKHHIRLLRSFISHTDIHIRGMLPPSQRVSLKASDLADVEILLRDHEDVLLRSGNLPEAIQKLDVLIQEFQGESLEGYYEQLPGQLRGMAEFFYHRNLSAGYRIFERRTYSQRFQRLRSQRLDFFSSGGLKRPHVFSTPRLKSQDSVFSLECSFSDPGIDAIFASGKKPVRFESLCGSLNLRREQQKDFSQLFEPANSEGPKAGSFRDRTGKTDGSSRLRISYFGHATLLLECEGISVLTDPLLAHASYEYKGRNSLCIHDLPEHIDYILITHAHTDHFHLETLLRLRHKTGTVIVPSSSGDILCDPSLALILKDCGFSRVMEAEPFESFDAGPFRITGIPFLGEHGDLQINGKISYFLSGGGHNTLILSDSKNISPELWDYFHEEDIRVESLFIGMECDGAPFTWIYGPLLHGRVPGHMAGSRRLTGSDASEVSRLIRKLGVRKVFVYAMGLEPWLGYLTGESMDLSGRAGTEYRKLCDEFSQSEVTVRLLYWEARNLPDHPEQEFLK